MKKFYLLALACLFAAVPAMRGELPAISEQAMAAAFQQKAGAFVLIDSASGAMFRSDAAACDEKVAPCSTFKIWNTAIGLELGIVTDPDALFWKWDGQKRDIEDWNKDQTLRTAMAVSCVPAYQALAKKIGAEQMAKWLKLIGYGDENISAGIDVFWLPRPPARKTLLISPTEQARLVSRLFSGGMPFSEKTIATLKSVMKLKATERGTFYGKTGTGTGEDGRYAWGWFVGCVESGGKRYAFACLLKGAGVMGKDARAVAESILTSAGLL